MTVDRAMAVREFRNRRPRREAQGHHMYRRGAFEDKYGGELGHHSFGYFSWMSKTMKRSGIAVQGNLQVSRNQK